MNDHLGIISTDNIINILTSAQHDQHDPEAHQLYCLHTLIWTISDIFKSHILL
jgi:hypothetical protein